MNNESRIIQELQDKFNNITFICQTTQDDIPTLWVSKDKVHNVLRFCQRENYCNG